MTARRRRGAALLVAAATVAFASGCSGGGSTGAPPSVEKPDLSVAVVPALDSAGFFVALYGGLFAKAGLHVNFTPATSSDTVISAQVKGQYDITGGNYVSYIQAEAAGQANLDVFAEASVMEPGTQGIYVMPNSPIKSLTDLKGKTVAINAPKNILYLLAASVLAEHGLSANSVTFVTNIPFPAMPAALKAGTINAAVLPEPFANYPFTSGPLGTVDKVRLQRVVDVMQQFLKFNSSFNINSMLVGG